MRLLLMALAVCGSDFPYAYSGSPEHKAEIVQRASVAFQEGWTLMTQVVGSDRDPPRLVEVEWSQSYLCLYEGTSSAPAMTFGVSRKAIAVYDALFRTKPPPERSQIIAHELLHFYYGLPDQYVQADPSKDHPWCVMGNFPLRGWSGRLCEPCRESVDLQRRRRWSVR